MLVNSTSHKPLRVCCVRYHLAPPVHSIPIICTISVFFVLNTAVAKILRKLLLASLQNTQSDHPLTHSFTHTHTHTDHSRRELLLSSSRMSRLSSKIRDISAWLHQRTWITDNNMDPLWPHSQSKILIEQ